MIINIQNPGSALGEAIGAEMEKALNEYLSQLVEHLGYYFISKSPLKNRKRLLMYDDFGTAYNLDAVIANESMQPIILFESKYIRYTKHNRDKGSWVCTAHPAIRKRYGSVRSSIAVLAGNWSSSSLSMMKSYDINIFLIPFSRICDLLLNHDIQFNWDEKDRKTAIIAWKKYSTLTPEQKFQIGVQMIDFIKDELGNLVTKILDDTLKRELDQILIELHSNLGEVKAFKFSSIEDAINFLNLNEFTEIFISTDSLTLFDPPPEINDEVK